MKRFTSFFLALALSHTPATTWSAEMKSSVPQHNINNLLKAGLAIGMYLVGSDKNVLTIKSKRGIVYDRYGKKITLHGNGKASVESKIGTKLGTHPLVVRSTDLNGKYEFKDRFIYYNIRSEDDLEKWYLEGSMKIYYVNLTGKHIAVYANSNDTIKDIKAKIAWKEYILVDQQRLMLDNKPLEDRKKLSEYSIQKKSTLYLEHRMINPSKEAKSIKLKNKKEINTKPASSNAIRNGKSYKAGMNVQGVCKNETCHLYSQKIWVKLGYSQDKNLDDDDRIVIKHGMQWFNFGLVRKQCKCVACKQQLHKAETVGFYACKYKIRGILSNEDKDINVPKIPKQVANHDQYWKTNRWKKAYASTQSNKLIKCLISKLGAEDKPCEYISLYIAVERIN